MKSLKVGFLISVMALVFFSAAGSAHATIAFIEEGYSLKFTNGLGSFLNGGSFGVYKDTVSDANFWNWTFCLERDEFINYSDSYKVNTITKTAINGGSGGPDPDPIDSKTAWLFYHFITTKLSTLVPTFSYTQDSSYGALQEAIWILEEEYSGTPTALAAALITAASLDPWVGTDGIWVLNMVDTNGNVAQDMLYYDKDRRIPPVPEPSTLLLLGAGLVGLGIWRRSRSK